ncbi:MAG TPA: class I SAM-dependent methyltransferase [Methanomicrobiales archaeon]|nr:class I SAM-dependent methyltransferase [Methanomicrobiales archaeon]
MRERNASRILEAKLAAADAETRALVTGEDERRHYGDLDLDDPGLQNVARSFTLDRIRFIREVFPGGVSGTVVDLGDTNGIFLRSLGKKGIGVNLSGPAVRSLRARGLETLQADIGSLPFRDDSVDVVLLFETLEHVPDPIRVLREIGRVTKRSLVLSIPLVGRTAIHGERYDPGRPAAQHHIFEFSVPDFREIVTHTPFEIERDRVATVLGGGGGALDRLVISLWSVFREPDMFCGCFRRFYLCHLVRKEPDPGDPGKGRLVAPCR